MTIDSGNAACALPVGVASAVGMQELNRASQQHIAANAERIQELGFRDSDTQIPEWRRAEFEVQCHGRVAQTIGGGVQSGRCRQSDRATAREPRWLVHVGRAFEGRKRIYGRNGVYVLPCWLVKQNSQKRLALLDESYPNGRQIQPYVQSPGAEESGPVRADGSGPVQADGFTDLEKAQEAEELKSVLPPVLPSKEEVEAHIVSHLPFRSW